MRNALFLAIIALLVGYIYFFEEKKTIQEYQDRAKAESLLDIQNAGELTYLKGKNFLLEKKGTKFLIDGGFELSKKQLNTFFTQLQNIKAQRVLKNEELNSIPQNHLYSKDKISLEIGFKNSKVTIGLGKKIEFNQNFYLNVYNHSQKTTKWVVAKYQNTYSGHSQEKDQYRSDVAYKQAQSLFLVSSDFFKELNPFHNVSKISKLEVNSFRNRPYTIDLEKKQTLPASPVGVDEIANRFEQYQKGFTSLKAKKVIKAQGKELKDSMGSISIDNKVFKSFRLLDDTQGYYLLNDSDIFVIDSQTYRFLFTPQQFFWNKKPNLIQEDYKVLKKNGELVLESNIKTRNIWSQVLSSEAYSVRKNYKKKFNSYYRVELASQIFLVGQSENGLELYDIEKDLIFHYLEKIK